MERHAAAHGLSLVLVLTGCVASPAHCAQAQAFPTRAVRIVVPTTPGGTLDLVARLVAQKLSEYWGYGVIVDNRAGAGGIIGTDVAAKATPDGHTIAFVASTFTVTASVHKNLPYDSLRDFAPVTLATFSPWVLVVNPSLPVHSVKELIALAKEKPGQINYASTGSGGATHLAAELLKSMAGVDITHVPYKGSVQAVNDVISGQVQLTITGLTATASNVAAGKLRLIAMTGRKRAAAFPDVPTIGESVPGYEYNNWFGVLAPQATPNDIILQLHDGIVRALQAQELRQLLLAQSIEPVGSSPAQFGDTIREEISKYTKLARKIGVKVD